MKTLQKVVVLLFLLTFCKALNAFDPESSLISKTDVYWMALNIYHEDSGEPIQGQVAIAMVTMKHASSDAESTCDVIYDRKQFT